MVHHSTVRVLGARPRARVHALLIDARAIRRAIGADGALWPAVWCGADHSRQTAALSSTADHLAFRVRTARVRIARIRWNRSQSALFNYRCRNSS